MGLEPILLWVLEQNPSRGFYERLGGRLVGSQPIEIGGKRLTEVAYGWDHLSLLLG